MAGKGNDMKKALILTVGTGTRPDVNIVRPLVKTVRDSRPDYTVFVATADSREHAETIAADLALEPSASCIKVLDRFDDVEAVFREVGKVIRDVFDRGFAANDIQIDFTSGTKAMSAGAVLAAVHYNCGSLKYIAGDRQDGIVKDGTERFVGLCPQAVFANHDIKMAVELIKRLRFQPALQILEGISQNLLDQDGLKLVASLKAVARAYDFWDCFEHLKFMGAIRKVDWRFSELRPFWVEDRVVKSVHRIGEVLRAEEPTFTREVMVDLYNNAERRAMEGRYDDALARLYRLAEMLGQYVLDTRHGIDTGNVDSRKVPPELRPTVEVHRDMSGDGKIRIGLKKSYELLASLKEEIGKKYLSGKRLGHLLNERNRTILAHGHKPVALELYQSLQEQVVGLIAQEIEDFQVRARELNFPWLVG